MLLQFSSAQGPEECCIAVEKTLNYFLTVTEQRQVDVIILEQEPISLWFKVSISIA